MSLEHLRASLADRYTIERQLGAGGMATVYLAHDLKHDRQVAIKVLRPELAAVIGAERFLAEIKTTANLQHPHILALFDSGQVDGTVFYVMPFVEGESLRDRLTREKQLPIDDALQIAREVADALQYAHGHAVIHRDIKPENILLHGGHALVADFGIALAATKTGGTRMTETGMSLGTPHYMSPEQAMGERDLDARADIYALGCVTYEMLVGDPPFTASTAQAIVAKVMTEKPASIIARRDRVPVHVEDAVLTALEKLPADRFATAAEFATALSTTAPRRHRAGGTLAGVRPRAGRLGAAAVTLVAAAALGGWLLGRRGPNPAANVVETSIVLPDSLPLEPLRPVPEGLASIALSPDGSQLAFVARHGTTTQLFLRRLSDFTVRRLEGTDSASTPVFSPDGESLAFVSGTSLKRILLGDGRISVITTNVPEVWGLAWRSDDRIVVSRYRAEQLLVVSATTGDSLFTVRCTLECTFPDFLPDGQQVLVSGGSGINVVNLAARTERPVARWQAPTAADAIRGTMARYDGDGHLVFVSPTGQLYAAPFDARRAKVTGPSILLAEGVRVESGRGAAQFALSTAGVLAFAPGPVASQGILVRSDRRGVLDTIPVPAAIYNSLDLSPDGSRLVTQVTAPNGESSIEVIDVASGRMTPWLTRPRGLGRPEWAPDGQRIVFVGGDTVFIGDPFLSTPPQVLPVPGGSFGGLLPRGERYEGFARDMIIIARIDGAGNPLRLPASIAGTGAVTPDERWEISEEQLGSGLAIVARALDSTGRRQVVVPGDQFAMTGGVSGSNEVIVADGGGTESRQGFWSIRYDASKPEPFTAPQLLFRADVADFPGRNYAVGMAGQRFVFKQHVSSAMPREVRLLQHWHSLLRSRATSGDGTRHP